MPRPRQRARATRQAAVQRKTKPPVPPPIRHKARQKAIHNARRGRGRAQTTGGRPSRNQSSEQDAEKDFVSFSNKGNNFQMLNGAGSRKHPIALDGTGDSDLEDGEVTDTSESDSEDIDIHDLDMYDAEDMMINVEVSQTFKSKSNVRRAEVMFTVSNAVSIYRELRQAGFPLLQDRMVRYGLQDEGTTPDSASYRSRAHSPTSRQPSFSSATSHASHAEPQQHNPASDYVFNFGKHSGIRFQDAPENYLRTIGGQLDVYEVKHPGLREAFEYFRPGQARIAPPGPSHPGRLPQTVPRQPPQSQTKQSLLPVAPKRRITRSAGKSPSDLYVFLKGPFKGRKLPEVPENYLRTLEGMPRVVAKWPGFVPALIDFNTKTGRQSRI